MNVPPLPPGQQWAASGKWPLVGERTPRHDDSPWTLTIAGAVARPFSCTLDELSSLSQQEQAIDIHCVTRWSRPEVRFSGVMLSALLDRAQPAPAARFVSFVARSARAHSTSLPLADALEFLELAPKVPVRSHIVTMPLSEANVALDRLRAGKFTGAAVLIPDGAL